MTRLTKLASAALIALALAGGTAYTLASDTSAPALAGAPTCGRQDDCEPPPPPPPPTFQEDAPAYKRGSFDITDAEGSEELLASAGKVSYSD